MPIVEFEGKQHQFPDDFSKEEIARALESMHPIPGMEKLGRLPMAGNAPQGVVQPISGSTPLPSESGLESGARAGYLAKYGMQPPDSLGSGAPGMGPEGIAPAMLSTPGALATSIGAGYATRSGLKSIGVPEPIAEAGGLAASLGMGGLYGKFLPELIPSKVGPRATAAMNVIPGMGDRFNRYLSAIKGIPEPTPPFPAPPLMRQAVETTPEGISPPPLMKQKVVIEKAPRVPKPPAIPVPPVQGSSLARMEPPPAATATPAMESPVPATAATFRHSAQHTDLMRQIHAIGKELELPGSPAGKDAHAVISDAAKKIYGVKSLSDLKYDQLQSLNEFILKHKTIPQIPAPPK